MARRFQRFRRTRARFRRGPRLYSENGAQRFEVANFSALVDQTTFGNSDGGSTTNIIELVPGNVWEETAGTLQASIAQASRGFVLAGIIYDVGLAWNIPELENITFEPDFQTTQIFGHILCIDTLDASGVPNGVFWQPDITDFPVSVSPLSRERDRPIRLLHRRFTTLAYSLTTFTGGTLAFSSAGQHVSDSSFVHNRVKLGRRRLTDHQALTLYLTNYGGGDFEVPPVGVQGGARWSVQGSLYYRWLT